MALVFVVIAVAYERVQTTVSVGSGPGGSEHGFPFVFTGNTCKFGIGDDGVVTGSRPIASVDAYLADMFIGLLASAAGARLFSKKTATLEKPQEPRRKISAHI